MKYRIKPRPFICLGIILVSVFSGIFFSNLIRKELQKKAARIEKSILIKNTLRFTSLKNGEFIAEGRITAKDPQVWALPGLPGKYLEIKAVQEEYRSHTRTVSKPDGDGGVKVEIENYHSWDEIKTHTLISDSIIFLGRTFGIRDVQFSHYPGYNTVIEHSSNLRTVFYTYPEQTGVGILKGEAKNGKMSKLVFKEGRTIESEKARYLKKQKTTPIGFLVIWLIFGAILTVIVYRYDEL